MRQTVTQQNQTAINEEVAVQRVVRITWQSLLTNIDTLGRVNDAFGLRVNDGSFLFSPTLHSMSFRIFHSLLFLSMGRVPITSSGIHTYDSNIILIIWLLVRIINLLSSVTIRIVLFHINRMYHSQIKLQILSTVIHIFSSIIFSQ